MHPISALMISRYMEEEQRHRLERRRREQRRAERVDREPRDGSWIQRIRLPRLGFSGS